MIFPPILPGLAFEAGQILSTSSMRLENNIIIRSKSQLFS